MVASLCMCWDNTYNSAFGMVSGLKTESPTAKETLA